MTYTIRTDGSESTGPEGVYIVWGQDWGGVVARECDDLNDALFAFRVWEMSDYGGPDCIEGPAGVVSAYEIEMWSTAHAARERVRTESIRDAMDGRQRFEVQLREPCGSHVAEFDGFDDLSDAIAELGRLNRPGRTRIVLKAFHDGRWQDERVVIDWATAEGQAAA